MKALRFSSDVSPVADRGWPPHFAALISSVAVALALAAVPTPGEARDVSLGQAANYAVFQVGGSTLSSTNIGGSTTNGDVALGSGAGAGLSVDVSSIINGMVYNDSSNLPLSNNLNPDNSVNGTITGGINNSTSLSQAGTDAASAVTNVNGLTPTQTFGSGIFNGTTINATAALNVISVSGLLALFGATNTLTLSGSANDWFVF